MKYLLAITLFVLVFSNAQTPAQKIDHAFDLLDQAPYWQSRSTTESGDGSVTIIDTDSVNHGKSAPQTPKGKTVAVIAVSVP